MGEKDTLAQVVKPDASLVEGKDWPFRDFPPVAGERGPGFQIVCRRSVLQKIRQHGQETTEVEVCGVLVGNVFQDDLGPFLYVEAAIRGEHAGNLAAQVTFTSETWTYIHQEMESHPDQRILGWYHTHPDFGIFLSVPDLFIHENFFNSDWQVAYVFDPVRDEEGMFVWRQGRANRELYLVEEDSTATKKTGAQRILCTAAAMDSSAVEKRVSRLELRVTILAFILALVVLLTLAWPETWARIRAWVDQNPTKQLNEPD